MIASKFLVFHNLRPPVCTDARSGSPLRSKSAKRSKQLGKGDFQDRSGAKITKDWIAHQITDDGLLVDVNWNTRHFVHPSLFNPSNSKYFKVRNQPHI